MPMLTPHFSLGELMSHDGHHVPEALRGNAREVCAEAEGIRTAAGEPILVVCGYRTEAHNAAVRGAEHSQHRLARALDIRIAGWPPDRLHALILDLIHRRMVRDGGLGLYMPSATRRYGFVHYDIGPAGRRWRG